MVLLFSFHSMPLKCMNEAIETHRPQNNTIIYALCAMYEHEFDIWPAHFL